MHKWYITRRIASGGTAYAYIRHAILKLSHWLYISVYYIRGGTAYA
jgi:hypothetical protein